MSKWILIQKAQPRPGQKIFAKFGNPSQCAYMAPDGREMVLVVEGKTAKAWRPCTQLDVILQRTRLLRDRQEYDALYDAFLREAPKPLREWLESEVPDEILPDH